MQHKLVHIALLFSCFFQLSYAQLDFSKSEQHYVNGDAAIIGNTILSVHESKAFNDFSLLNDQVKMTYVDIDKDGSTFNSSAATIKLPLPDAKIVSATLYWAATYPFEKGVKKDNGEEIVYKGNDKRDSNITEVLLKTPGAAYQKVSGRILFDAFDKEGYSESAPYVCFADVTNLMPQSSAEGLYTVANIRATQGFMSGGCAGGWFLFVIYEHPELNSKYITAYHGFQNFIDNWVDIPFEDFMNKNQGQTKAHIFLSTLEGDAKLSKDECSILNMADSSFVPLKNGLRASKNFFNGRITNGESYLKGRVPNSSNALGFDLVKMSIPSKLFSAGQTETTVRVGTKADRFYLYFTAFAIEINEKFHLDKEAVSSEELVDSAKAVADNEIPQDENSEPELKAEAAKQAKAEVKKEAILTQEEVRNLERKMRTVKLNIPNLKPGYYLITNVFSKPHYATKWENFLSEKGHEPFTFINPKNQWRYVSVYDSPEIQPVFNSYKKLVNIDYFKEIWVFKINLK